MKNRMLNRVKGILAVMLTACMLLTIGNVSSDAEYGIMPCEGTVEAKNGESD